ncbi:uncharacterized protein METZ01_LOCUS85236 [marine metagenome]|uniref:Uncharacterized protein n=1 Tax=marine metagenome TaxID=408172 RepID=A0A381UW62_9ZZZZ|tara:strand:+ start:3271 stop:3675 length:405 start_codon:yes stop_codon:yes gene_type:complete
MEPKANLPSNKYFDNKMDIINIKYKLMLLKKNKQDYVNNYNEMKKLAAFFQYMKLMENFKKEELNAEINRIRYRIKLKNIFRYTSLLVLILFFYYKYSKPLNNYFVTIRYTLKKWSIISQNYLNKNRLHSISLS